MLFPSDYDVPAFLWEHRRRYDAIRREEWTDEYNRASYYDRVMMVATRNFEQYLFTEGTYKLATVRMLQSCPEMNDESQDQGQEIS